MAKVLVSIDDALLRRIDAQADRRGMTRSAYIAELARERLETPAPRDATTIRSVHRAREACRAAVKPADSTDVIRRMRDER